MSAIMEEPAIARNLKPDAFLHLLDLERELSRQAHARDMNTATMTALRAFIGADSAAVISVDTSDEEWRWGDTNCENLPLDYHQTYLDRFGYEDPVGALSLKGKARKGDVLSHSFNPDDARPFYEKFYYPQDIHHVLGVVVMLDRCLISIGLHRRRERTNFDHHSASLALLAGRILASHYHRVSEFPIASVADTDLMHAGMEAAARHMGFSPREAEVVQLVERGLTNGEIALVLSISVMTVQNHLRSIYRKAEVQNRASLIFEMHCMAKPGMRLS